MDPSGLSSAPQPGAGPVLTAQDAAYLRAVRSAAAQGLVMGSSVCAECGCHIEPHDADHTMVEEAVVIGCEGYYMIAPARVGLDLPHWEPTTG